MKSRFAKIAGVAAASAMAMGTLVVAGGQIASARSSVVHYKTIGFAAGTIGDDGSFSATVNGTGNGGATSTTSIVGQLTTGSGIGARGSSGSAALSEGSFSASFVSSQRTTSGPDASGTVSGTVSPAGSSPVATDMSYNFTCTVSYPPLAVQCSVTLKWTTPAT
jgi:hypothetical protein